jgi:hypothetical protein
VAQSVQPKHNPPFCQASTKEVWTLLSHLCHVQNILPAQTTSSLANPQCLPCITSHALQRNFPERQMIPGTHSRTCQWTTEWEVECILVARKRCQQLQYLVRWKGFSEAHDSWEPLAHINANQLIQESYSKNTSTIRTMYKASPKPHSNPITICNITIMSNLSSNISSPSIPPLPFPLSSHQQHLLCQFPYASQTISLTLLAPYSH